MIIYGLQEAIGGYKYQSSDPHIAQLKHFRCLQHVRDVRVTDGSASYALGRAITRLVLNLIMMTTIITMNNAGCLLLLLLIAIAIISTGTLAISRFQELEPSRSS